MTVTVLATVAVAFAAQEEPLDEPQNEGGRAYGLHKVPICHKGHVISVASPAWPAHERHGDTEGACTEGVTPEPVAPETPEGATLELTTVATPEVTLGQPISDMATLSGATSATGTITFNAYGPDDEDCSGGPAFTSEVDVEGDGEYSSDTTPDDPSDDFVPDAAGTYRWTAEYIGDTDNETETASSECNAEGEQSVVNEGPAPTGTEQSMTLAGEIGEDANLADPAADTTNIEGTNQNDNTTLGTDSADHL